jgi:glucosamine--fructose-6-phosphate aminotransferase (isomerizing)
MRREAAEGPAVVARQLAAGTEVWRDFALLLREQPPASLLTVARGSSDHAAHYASYLIMARLGRLVTSLPMSLITLYRTYLDCRGLAAFGFSQSGQSPDLVEPMMLFRAGRAITSAIVNDVDSPLARVVDWVLPLHAGEERSVAATKSFIAQLVAAARLVAHWQADDAMHAALQRLPDALERAWRSDWSRAVEALHTAQGLFVIGRGLGLPVAQEAALKFKEVCGIQAEAFSAAEVQHGPMALVEDGFPLLVFAPRGPAQAGLLALARTMRERGAAVLLAAPPAVAGADLPLVETASPDLDPIAVVQAFYGMAEALARARGLDPDKPPHLRKVTRTQ